MTQNIVYKQPPFNIDAEEAVLGALLIDRSVYQEVSDILDGSCFYKQANSVVYEAISELAKVGAAIDLITVKDKLISMGKLDFVGGAVYLVELCSKVSSAAHVGNHARLILEKYMIRKMIMLCAQKHRECFDDSVDAFDLLDAFEKEVFSLSTRIHIGGHRTLGDLLNENIRQIEQAKARNNPINGIISGFPVIDNMTKGWQKQNLIILAARPGMGKSALALNMARNAAVMQNRSIAVFSLEMSAEEMSMRLLISETGIESDRIKSGNINESEWKKITGINSLFQSKIFIDDTSGMNMQKIRTRCRKLVREHGVEMIIIDYLQLLHGEKNKNSSREQEISQISSGLKELAKELKVPVLALSQLSRAVESRADKKPILSDLRESGSIEQDADIVMFIYRPHAAGITQSPEGRSTFGEAEVIISKHRNGACGSIPMKFNGDLIKFMSENEEVPYKPAFARNPSESMNQAFEEHSPF